MQAITSGKHARFCLLPTFGAQGTDEAFILANTILGYCKAITVRDFIGEACTNASLFNGVGYDIQASLYCIGTGMMIDNTCCAITYGISHKYFGTGTSIFQSQEFIKPPPQALQDFGEIARRITRDSHATGKCAIKMRMCAKEARHNQAV